VNDALRTAGREPRAVDAVVLAGGSSRVPLVRAMVESFFERPACAGIDPELVIAQGAAIHGYAIAPVAPSSKTTLGRITLRERQPRFAEPLPRQPAFAPDWGVDKMARAVELASVPPVSSQPTALSVVSASIPSLPTFVVRGRAVSSASLRPPPVPAEASEVVLDDAAESTSSNAWFEVAPAMQPVSGFIVRQPAIQTEGRPAPLLLDVAPHSLGVETAGGYCKEIVPRNAPIPTEMTRTFATASDQQSEVSLRVCQGGAHRFAENEALGELTIGPLRQASRGEVQIEVTFIINQDGTLDVKAVDTDSGRKQGIRIDLMGGIAEAEVVAMRARQEALLEALEAS
jgi:molecular chaperone DnaK